VVDPNASMGDFISPADLNACGARCHHDSPLQFSHGTLRLVARVTDSGGGAAQDERTFTVDHSTYVHVAVRIVLEDGSEAHNVPVHAGARMYLWRARRFTTSASTTADATLQLEALGLVPTHYLVSVPPAIVNGVLYESVKPVELVLTPGEPIPGPITVEVRARQASLSGTVAVREGSFSLPEAILLVQQAAGHTLAAPLHDGAFTFADLPLDRYLLTLDPWLLAQAGYFDPASQSLDLTALSAQPELDLTQEMSLPTPAEHTVQGQVLDDATGAPLPFAWIQPPAGAPCAQALPAPLGAFACPLEGDLPPALTARAPGYFTQALALPDDADRLTFRLVRRPETTALPWGGGEIILPPETHTRPGDTLALESGWLWGDSRGEGAEPFTLMIGTLRLELLSGAFAVEYRPGQAEWLYLHHGEALLYPPAGAPLMLSAPEGGAGLLVPLSAGALPVDPAPASPGAVHALHLPLRPAPVPESWQPGLAVLLRNRLALLGIGLAAGVTSVTYALIVAAALLAPFTLALLLARGRRGGK
jgi:hypothetical protein